MELFCFYNMLFLEDHWWDLYKVSYEYKPTNFYFTCKNDSPLVADRGMNTHLYHGNSYKYDLSDQTMTTSLLGLLLWFLEMLTLLLDSTCQHSLVLLLSLTSEDSCKPVMALTSLLSFNSHRKVTILFPVSSISWLICLEIQKNMCFPRNAVKEFPHRRNTSGPLLNLINWYDGHILNLIKFSCLGLLLLLAGGEKFSLFQSCKYLDLWTFSILFCSYFQSYHFSSESTSFSE